MDANLSNLLLVGGTVAIALAIVVWCFWPHANTTILSQGDSPYGYNPEDEDSPII